MTATTTTTNPIFSAVTVHIFWAIIVLLILAGGHFWLQEHDARVRDEQTIAAGQATVKALTQQIAANDQKYEATERQLESLIASVKTPAQAAVAIPQVVTLPAPIIHNQDDSLTVPAPDVQPIFNGLADDSLSKEQLAQCTADLSAEKQIAVTDTGTIQALKKKPGIFHRMGSALKLIGIGVGIGAFLGAHAL